MVEQFSKPLQVDSYRKVILPNRLGIIIFQEQGIPLFTNQDAIEWLKDFERCSIGIWQGDGSWGPYGIHNQVTGLGVVENWVDPPHDHLYT